MLLPLLSGITASAARHPHLLFGGTPEVGETWFSVAAGMCSTIVVSKEGESSKDSVVFGFDFVPSDSMAFKDFPKHISRVDAPGDRTHVSSQEWVGKHLAISLPNPLTSAVSSDADAVSWWYGTNLVVLEVDSSGACGAGKGCVRLEGHTAAASAAWEAGDLNYKTPCSVFLASLPSPPSSPPASGIVLASTGMCQDATITEDGDLSFAFGAAYLARMTISDPLSADFVASASDPTALRSEVWQERNAGMVIMPSAGALDGTVPQEMAVFVISTAECASWDPVDGWDSTDKDTCSRYTGQITGRTPGFKFPEDSFSFPCQLYVDSATFDPATFVWDAQENVDNSTRPNPGYHELDPGFDPSTFEWETQ